MRSDLTIRELAELALDKEQICEVWTPLSGTIFIGTYREVMRSEYANCSIDNYSVEDDKIIMNV